MRDHRNVFVLGRLALSSLLLLLLISVGLLAPGPALSAQGKAKAEPLALAIFDANSEYTSSVFLPLPSETAVALAPLTTQDWNAGARPVSKVAADGVTLLLLRARLPDGYRGPVQFRIDGSPGDPGSLWRVDERKLLDVSARGGARDRDPPGHKNLLTVHAVPIGGASYAFALYRAPRDFDAERGADTASVRERTAEIRVQTPGKPGSGEIVESLAVVRPLVIHIHGTWGSPATWENFPLWKDSANEVRNFQFDAGVALPFYAHRVNFNDFLAAAGPVVETAQLVLPRIQAALKTWREATGIAGTQADVITHSFGGFVTRMVVQTQPDPNPLTPDAGHNFRSATNWGHGSIHKLVTLAATHRGSADANHSAYLNHFGKTAGALRHDAIAEGVPIDNGAVRDQMILSPALRALQETRVPGHAIAGSGLVRFDPNYLFELAILANYDIPEGPYAKPLSLGSGDDTPNFCAFNQLTNYLFSLDYHTPPLGPEPNCDLVPDYDLTVSEWSSRGLMPDRAFSNVFDIDPTGSLVGQLNHTQLHDSQAVADRVAFLLRQPTTSRYFAFFPAVMAIPPTDLEQRFSEYDPAWLEE
jgi:hypothetical protein